MKNTSALKVLVVSSECAPFAKSGGLGDVIGSLPAVLKAKGVDVRVVIPKYKNIKNEHFIGIDYIGSFETHLSWRRQTAGVLFKKEPIKTYFIENDYYFGRDGFYGYYDDAERFAFFCRAVLEMLQFIDFFPDVIHCNDWQTGPVCIMLKEIFSRFTAYKNIKTLYTIHNLQYQGTFPREVMEMLELPDYCYSSMEFYGQISFMKSGLVYANAISTVSNTYANEIKTFQYGYGLDGVLRYREDRLFGILNGINYVDNNPETDERIFENYSIDTIEKKKINKTKLQEQLGLDVADIPLMGLVSRLANQKGLDLVAWIAEEILSRDVQFVILGTGERQLEEFFRGLELRHKGRVSANIRFDDTLAQRIYAGSDMFIMPSRFEPCGLGQMFSLRYGTIPVVRKTGGLSDTVDRYNPKTMRGNGFVFETYTADGLMWALDEALGVYYSGSWDSVVKNAMKSNNSWETSAQKYIDLYNKILNEY